MHRGVRVEADVEDGPVVVDPARARELHVREDVRVVVRGLLLHHRQAELSAGQLAVAAQRQPLRGQSVLMTWGLR